MENNMELRSKLRQISEINFDKELVITSLRADPKIVKQHTKRLTELLKNETPEQIKVRVNNIIIRDNVFNAAMEEIVKNFEFQYDEGEVKSIADKFKKAYGDERSQEILEEIARRIISKTLIFNELAKK